ncbi:MAG: hypothetical protein Q7R80_01875 [bacterium]|nr:hypothetical protein [bacterium]
MSDNRNLVHLDPKPVEPPSPRRALPPIVAKTVNLCVNCVTGAGRMVRDPLQRRHERHYHPRFRFGRYHLAADVVFIVAIIALIGTNVYLLRNRPKVLPSLVRLEWRVEPTTVRSGDAIPFTLAFRYDGDEPLDRATIALQLPEHLLITSAASGAYDAATRTMVLSGPIAPGASGDIQLDALTDAPDGTDLTVRATFYGSGATRSERTSVSATIPVRGAAFTFTIDAPPVVRSGPPGEIRASYAAADGGTAGVDARAFRVLIAGPLVAESTVTAKDGVFRRGEVRWPFRGERLPREAVEEVLVLTPPSHIDAFAFPATTRFAYTLTPELILAEDALGAPTARISGSPLTIDVAGELRVSASARYFTQEGDQVGRGPLPPRVEQTTKYWVTWEAQSFLRDADRVVVRAKLPDGVEWTGRVMSSVGEGIAYDSETRTVTWTLGRLERTIGDRRPDTSVSFELALTPTAVQVGASVSLLEETIAEGVDDLGTALRATAPTVTTELIGDQRARGKGRVE